MRKGVKALQLYPALPHNLRILPMRDRRAKAARVLASSGATKPGLFSSTICWLSPCHDMQVRAFGACRQHRVARWLGTLLNSKDDRSAVSGRTLDEQQLDEPTERVGYTCFWRQQNP